MKHNQKSNNTSTITPNDAELMMTIWQQFVNTKNMDQVNNDANFEEDSRKNITDRDISYTGLLNHYTFITKVRNYLKEIHKWIYFWIIMLLIIYFGIYVFRLLKNIDLTQMKSMENLAVVITSLISFSSVVISIPLIITKYLFSSKEDKRIADIILHTQDHDLSGRQWAIDFKKNITKTDHEFEYDNDLDDKKSPA